MSFEDAKRKEVVCAILSRRVGNEEQFLIGSRSGSDVFNGKFEFPGGKVEHGESLASALKLELASTSSSLPDTMASTFAMALIWRNL